MTRFAFGSVHRAGVHVVSVADPGKGLASLVEPDGVVDLAGIQALPTHADTLAVQVKGCGVAVDPETFRELLHRRSGPLP